MNVQLYNQTTKLAFIAILVIAIASIIQPLTSLMGGLDDFGSAISGRGVGFYSILRTFTNICILAAVILFCWCLFNLKGIVEGEAQGAVNMVFIAAAIAVLMAIFAFFMHGFFFALLGLASPIVYLIGYNQMKVAGGLPEDAHQGAGLCFVAAILLIIAAVLNLIPAAGGILCYLVSIPAYILLIIGWKKIATPVA